MSTLVARLIGSHHRSVTSGLSSFAPQPAWFGSTLDRGRARIEQAVGKLKRFKRIALRCEKTKRNFASFVALAAGFILVKSVHTAKYFRMLFEHSATLLLGHEQAIGRTEGLHAPETLFDALSIAVLVHHG